MVDQDPADVVDGCCWLVAASSLAHARVTITRRVEKNADTAWIRGACPPSADNTGIDWSTFSRTSMESAASLQMLLLLLVNQLHEDCRLGLRATQPAGVALVVVVNASRSACSSAATVYERTWRW